MNVINASLLVIGVAAVVGLARVGQWIGAVLFALAVLGALAWLAYARRGRGGDLARLDTGFAVDEREVRLAAEALSWVGVVAFSGQTALYAVDLATAGDPAWRVPEVVRVLVLALTWMVANRVVIRRGTA